MATQSSILAWKIPWMEEPAYLDGLSSECKISLCCIKSAHTPQVNGRGDHPFTMGWPAFSTSGTRRNTDHNDGDPPDVHRKLPSSAGEDRAMLLGFAMMGFSVLMFFVLGVTILKPFLLSTQREESNCTIIHVHTMDDWTDCAFTCGMDCRGQGKYPCLQLFVKLTHSGQKVLLHYNEEAVQINSKCFYTPKCHQHRNDLLSGALDIKEFFDHKNGTPFSCFYSPDSQSEDVILIKKWPSTTVGSGYLASANCRWKIFGRKSRKFQKAELEFATHRQLFTQPLMILGIVSNLELTKYTGGCA
uniref:Potassium calcium-activated channel subfamily M regulatory beta subunit 3 n=1 Tax=Bos taurus TaxID=9913 RepID=A0AAA9T163_BOVIN